jgi:uncharacterized protein (DUF697 family)
MALPLKPGAVFGLLREVSKAKDRPLLVLGALAEQLARELAEGGDAFAVRTGGPPTEVEALVYIVGDVVTEDDANVLKLAHRARVPIVVVAAGREAPQRSPFVLATDVVRAEPGHGFPVDAIAGTLAQKLGEDGTSLARHLPLLRPHVCAALVEQFARRNGLISAAVFIPGVDFPVLTLNQVRLVLRICAAHGLEVDNQRAPEIAATVIAGLGFRTLARELLDFVPFAGWLFKGAFAYTATKGLGEATIKYCETRTSSSAGGAAPTPRPGAVSGASS